MPLRNRVTPFGEIIETPARGLLYGNRGVLHDEHRRLVRTWQVRRWIACLLSFQGRRRAEQMPPGRYTGLYFLDEATAFAAGHRPCAECRREDYRRFQEAWLVARPGASTLADDMDRVLHADRLGADRSKRRYRAALEELPDGAIITEGGAAWLVLGDQLRMWTPFGYTEVRSRREGTEVDVLTPASIVAVIAAGYRPWIHPTA